MPTRAIEAASDALFRGEDGEARRRGRQRRADAVGLVAEQALAAGFGGMPAGVERVTKRAMAAGARR